MAAEDQGTAAAVATEQAGAEQAGQADQGGAPAQTTPAEQQAQRPERLTPAKIQMRASERARQMFEKLDGQRAERAAQAEKDAAREAEEAARPRDPKTGQFVSQAEGQGDGEAKPGAAAGQPTGAAPGQKPGAEKEGAKPTDQNGQPERFRVEIPEGHPLRQQGRDALSASDETEANAIRALLNGTYTRTREVDSLNTRLREAEREKTELQERLLVVDADAAAEHKFKQTPEYQAAVTKYHGLRDAEEAGHIPEGSAQEFWEAKVGQLFSGFRGVEIEARRGELAEQHAERAGNAWVAEAKARTEGLPAEVRALPGFDGWVDEALSEFNLAIEAGTLDRKLARTNPERYKGPIPAGDPEALHQAFKDFFTWFHLQQEPAFRRLVSDWNTKQGASQQAETARRATEAAAQAERDRKADANKAVDDFKRGALETRRAAPPNPAAAMQHGTRVPGGTATSNEPLAAKSQFDLQRKTAERAAGRAAAYFGGKR